MVNDLGRLIESHGLYWFELVGGADWRNDMVIGLGTVALVCPVLAFVFAVIAIVSRNEG